MAKGASKTKHEDPWVDKGLAGGGGGEKLRGGLSHLYVHLGKRI